MTDIFSQKKTNLQISNFYCKYCDYITCNKKDYHKHLLTAKHQKLTKIYEKSQKSEKNPNLSNCYECSCGKIYQHRQSLFNHKKICNLKEKNEKNEIQELKNELEQIKVGNKDELIIKLIKDNEEFKQLLKEQNSIISQQQQQISELIPKVGNTTIHNTNNNTNNTNNNNFNLNLFLNEKCKDAINLSEFIASIQFTEDDLKNSRINGGVSTLSNKMIKGLQELDVTKRPVHCTDVKRETMYIKEQEKWEKDENHQKIMEAFGNIAEKQRDYLWEWSDANPDTQNVYHPLNDVFHHTNVKVLDPINKKEQEGKKFIRNIAKEVTIDKQ